MSRTLVALVWLFACGCLRRQEISRGPEEEPLPVSFATLNGREVEVVALDLTSAGVHKKLMDHTAEELRRELAAAGAKVMEGAPLRLELELVGLGTRVEHTADQRCATIRGRFVLKGREYEPTGTLVEKCALQGSTAVAPSNSVAVLYLPAALFAAVSPDDSSQQARAYQLALNGVLHQLTRSLR